MAFMFRLKGEDGTPTNPPTFRFSVAPRRHDPACEKASCAWLPFETKRDFNRGQLSPGHAAPVARPALLALRARRGPKAFKVLKDRRGRRGLAATKS